jgi:hypothetical protein
MRQADIDRQLSNMAKAHGCGARTRAGHPCRQAAVTGRAKAPNAPWQADEAVDRVAMFRPLKPLPPDPFRHQHSAIAHGGKSSWARGFSMSRPFRDMSYVRRCLERDCARLSKPSQ